MDAPAPPSREVQRVQLAFPHRRDERPVQVHVAPLHDLKPDHRSHPTLFLYFTGSAGLQFCQNRARRNGASGTAGGRPSAWFLRSSEVTGKERLRSDESSERERQGRVLRWRSSSLKTSPL